MIKGIKGITVKILLKPKEDTNARIKIFLMRVISLSLREIIKGTKKKTGGS